MHILAQEKSRDGSSTATYVLWKTTDDCLVESSILYIHDRPIQWVICLPSSVGCQMACRICAVAENANDRNLTTEELNKIFDFSLQSVDITGQFQVSFMGQGEPFLNTKNIFTFCCNSYHKYSGLLFGFSTVGIAEGICELCSTEWVSRVKLQLSLHAWPPKKRATIITAEKVYPIKTALKESRVFSRITGSKVFLSYTILKGFNDSESDAMRIAKLALSGPFCLKICSYNPFPSGKYEPADNRTVEQFCRVLEFEGVDYYRFHSIGTDIAVGCGQTRINPRSP